MFIIYVLDTWSRNLNTKSALGCCMFGAVKLPKNGDPDKFEYGGYDVRYDARLQYLLSTDD